MDQLQTFNHGLFGKLQVTSVENKELFSLTNVAWSLGYTKKANGTEYLRHERINSIIKKLDIATFVHDGQDYIDESGLYDFIFEAGTNRAREFRKWVTSEVLPSIRKHGAYATPQTIENVMNDPEFGIQLLTNLKQERDKRSELEQQQKLDAPYTKFGKTFSNSNAAINVGSFAKMIYDEHGIKIGRNKLFAWLRDNDYLIKSGREKNNPKQPYVEQGLFDTSVTVVSHNTKGDLQHVTPLVTGKGQIKLTEKLLTEFGREVI